jgi:hypothetical protein
VGEMKKLVSWGEHTIDDMIKALTIYKKAIGGDKRVCITDAACNERFVEYELNLVEGEKDLYLVIENGEEW